MYATCHLKADELNEEIVQTLKNIYHQHEIVIRVRRTTVSKMWPFFGIQAGLSVSVSKS
jgi:hypothetical protein